MEKTLDFVVGAYIVNKNRVLLIKNKKYGDNWLPVGGNIKRNETPDEAVRREVEEETKLDIDFLEYPAPRPGNQREHALPFYTNFHSQSEEGYHQYSLNFLCKPKPESIDRIKLQKREAEEYWWFTEDELNLDSNRILPGVKATSIEALQRAKMYEKKSSFKLSLFLASRWRF